MPNASAPKDFQGLLLALQTYWADRGCALMQGYDLEVGAGTMNPATFLRVRKLAHDCAKLYLATRAGMKFPGLKDSSLAERELSRYADLLKVA